MGEPMLAVAEWLPPVVLGLFQGAVYGLLAIGLVLVYKGTRVFNFTQGEFGTFAAFVTFGLLENVGLPYGLAIVIALVLTVVLGLIVERLVVRPLLDAPRITLLVATVGVALLIIAVTIVVAKPEPRVLEPLVEGDVVLLDTGLSMQQIMVVFVLAGLAPILAYFFSRTNMGLAVLATSQDQLATRVVGISVPGMSRFIWSFAALLGGIAGVMQAPITVFEPAFMTTSTLIPAFTAAVVGGMTSLPGAFIGGILVGLVQGLFGSYLLTQVFAVPGATELSVFALLLAVLLVRPQGLLGKEI